MTDRLHRDRALPAGYQFGDARWRRPSDNAADQLRRRAHASTVDTADQKPGTSSAGSGIAIRFVKQWDLTPDPHPTRIPKHWNVIEGEDH